MSRYQSYYKKNARTSPENILAISLHSEETEQQWIDRLRSFGITDKTITRIRKVRTGKAFKEYCQTLVKSQ